MNRAEQPEPTAVGQATPEPGARVAGMDPGKILVAMIFIGYTLNFLDRQIVSILLEPIKAEMKISDSRLGLLTGLAFASFYAVLGIPIAALSDRMPRKTIIGVCMTLWSVTSALFGLAQNFTQMLVARLLVGVGEAGFAPAAFSMIADYFPREKRTTATAIGASGAMMGSMLGLVIGGVVAQHYGWRAAMFVAGFPGLIFALVFVLTVKEPRRGMSGDANAPMAVGGAQLANLGRNLGYVLIVVGASFSSLAVFGCLQWFPSYLIRVFHVSGGSVGAILGPTFGGVGGASLLASGLLTDRLMKGDVRWAVWLPSIGCVIGAPLLLASFFAHTEAMALVFFALGYFCCFLFSAPMTAIIQFLAPLQLRARATAIYLLVTTLVGFGLGPLVVGMVSDRLKPEMGVDALRFALASLVPALLIAPILLVLSGRSVKTRAEQRAG